MATGATPYVPDSLELADAHVVTAWDVLRERADVGRSVAIADWRADWIGLGIAEMLATRGCAVTLCTNAAMAGESLPLYTRNHHVGKLHRLDIRIMTHLRLFGADADTAYFIDTLTGEAVEVRDISTVVLSLGHCTDAGLEAQLTCTAAETVAIGDCVVPRTAEEAVYEGLEAGRRI